MRPQRSQNCGAEPTTVADLPFSPYSRPDVETDLMSALISSDHSTAALQAVRNWSTMKPLPFMTIQDTPAVDVNSSIHIL